MTEALNFKEAAKQ